MLIKKPNLKSKLHPRNRYRQDYNFEILKKVQPDLEPYILTNKYRNKTIDFFKPNAVKMLNNALLKQHYAIEYWDFPSNYLCPPIPGRLDYIHYVSDLLASSNKGSIPKGNNVRCLDIGVGANCIYPILGVMEYDWHFVASEVDKRSYASAQKIIDLNSKLKNKVELRLQTNSIDIFKGIIYPKEKIDLTICNPPFHSSAKEAEWSSKRKLKNLKKKKGEGLVLNFGGKSNELWYDGGEEKFLSQMIIQSKMFANNVLWFTSLISKESSLKAVYKKLKEMGVKDVKTIPMATGNKKSRIVAWTFLAKKERESWISPDIK
jgi:23S rRNA (adenine1618-N6)-methyltransferase